MEAKAKGCSDLPAVSEQKVENATNLAPYMAGRNLMKEIALRAPDSEVVVKFSGCSLKIGHNVNLKVKTSGSANLTKRKVLTFFPLGREMLRGSEMPYVQWCHAAPPANYNHYDLLGNTQLTCLNLFERMKRFCSEGKDVMFLGQANAPRSLAKSEIDSNVGSLRASVSPLSDSYVTERSNWYRLLLDLSFLLKKDGGPWCESGNAVLSFASSFFV